MEFTQYTLSQLQNMGLVTKTKQLSGGIGWGYKIFKKIDQCFSSSIWSEKEVVDNQKTLFPWLF